MVESSSEAMKSPEVGEDDARHDMLDYIMNMIEYVCSGDLKEDHRNMKLLAQSILERSIELQKAQLEKIKETKKKANKKEASAMPQHETLNKLAQAQIEGTHPPKLEEIMLMLENLRNFYLAEKKKGKKHKDIAKSMSSSVFDAGCYYYEASGLYARGSVAATYGVSATGLTAASAATSVTPLLAGGILYTAQMGLNYRKLKKG